MQNVNNQGRFQMGLRWSGRRELRKAKNETLRAGNRVELQLVLSGESGFGEGEIKMDFVAL